MTLENYFAQLTSKLQEVAKQWPTATDKARLGLANELLELRKASDHVIDLWMRFEESLSTVIKTVKEEQLTAFMPEADDEAIAVNTAGSAEDTEPDEAFPAFPVHGEKRHPHEPLFRKGEGFYHLRLYQDAKTCFDELMKHSPDWEMGRLYYAYSLLLSGDQEQGLKEFRLLSRTSSSQRVMSISYNAIGCILADEEQWLEAAQAFKAAIEVDPDYADAHFNLALCYLHDEEVEDAFNSVERYMELEQDDWEAEAIWLRAAQSLVKSDLQTKEMVPPGRLKVPARVLGSNTLYEMATMYEARGQIHRAQLCYVYLREQLPLEGWVYQGLAWNTWLIAGTRVALPLMKKAITLTPENLDFQFTYGWMLLFDGKMDEAIRVFRSILQKKSDHHLTRSGMVSAYERMGEMESARQLARQFLQETDNPYLQSLGYFHLGRLAIMEENWQLADQYFQRVQENDFREVALYRRLCDTKLGKIDTQADTELPIIPLPKP
ncbi:tetratricopeptide repeat protein [Brevibacillus migulae]|uniref:tetratricopeptide repeat protein n=1 Tax=Brevibacillus migulae TaxID=1644114 RepID=UPI00106E93E0|nr:tetratricopeptide repeat protein [Brevibacillus migulae]